MQPTNLQLLKAVRRGIAQLKHDPSASAAILADLDLAVGELQARELTRPESFRKSYSQARALALRATALARTAGHRVASEQANSLPADAAGDLDALDRLHRRAREVLTRCVLALNDALSGGEQPIDWQDDARVLFRDLAALESARAAADHLPAPATATSSSSDADSIHRIKAFFRNWTCPLGPLETLEIRTLSGGFSRETLLARLRNDQGVETTLIVRKQLPGGLLGSSCLDLAGEIPFLKLAHSAGLPVSQVYWHERDASILGGEFIVMSCLRGATLGSSIAPGVPIGEGILRELAQTLAGLHQIEWSCAARELCSASNLPDSTEISAQQGARAVCTAFESMWREANLDSLPMLELILDWLKRNVPQAARPAMISHGDIGFHNLMADAEHLTGLIDWETARLADPAKDMAMVKQFVTAHVPWNRFVGWYTEAGGPEIDEASLDYYGVFHAFSHLLVCEVAMGARFAQAAEPSLAYLQLGLPIRAYFANQMLTDCSAIWRQSSAAT